MSTSISIYHRNLILTNTWKIKEETNNAEENHTVENIIKARIDSLKRGMDKSRMNSDQEKSHRITKSKEQ